MLADLETLPERDAATVATRGMIAEASHGKRLYWWVVMLVPNRSTLLRRFRLQALV